MVLDLQLDIKPLPPIKATKSPFTYGQQGFRVGDIVRESPDRLQRLLFPDEVKGKREQKRAAEEAKRLKVMNRAWAEAQCQFYAIDLKGAKTSAEVQRRLKDKVKTSQVCHLQSHPE